MRHAITICACVLFFALGSLTGGQVRSSPITSSVAQLPCLHQYQTGIAACTDNKIVQLTWSFPLTDFVGNQIPKGCPIALQMTRNANVPVGQQPYTSLQYIYSNYPGSGYIGGAAFFGPTLPADNAWWLQVKAGLNAQ
jgi:hypothetical protein